MKIKMFAETIKTLYSPTVNQIDSTNTMSPTFQEPQSEILVSFDRKSNANVQKILEELSLSPVQVVQAFWREIERTGRVPIPFASDDIRKNTK